MSFNIDFRPKTFDEILGNSHILGSLEAMIKKPDHPHSFLFHGPSGCGKTTIARILASLLGCGPNSISEINMSNNRGIDTARDIINHLQFKSLMGGNRAYILDEVHAATKDFQNALLKALEEPPSHSYFLLCTTDPTKLLLTIRNRCSIYEVTPLQDKYLLYLIKHVCKTLHKDLPPSEVIRKILDSSEGSPRKVLISLEQIIDLDPQEMLTSVRSIEDKEKRAIDLCRCLIKGLDWKEVSTLLKEFKDDHEMTRRMVLSYCTQVLLKGKNDQAALIMDCFSKPFYDTGFSGLVLACYLASK